MSRPLPKIGLKGCFLILAMILLGWGLILGIGWLIFRGIYLTIASIEG